MTAIAESTDGFLVQRQVSVMLSAFRMIPALQVIFRSEIEFTEESFAELTAAQREAYRRKVGEPDEQIFQVLPFEPTVIERHGKERITLELSVVTKSQRQELLDAVRFVYRASDEMREKSPSFKQQLAYLRLRLPPVVIGEIDHDGARGP